MKIVDLQLDENISSFKVMAEPHYMEHLREMGRTPDWMDSMVWSKIVTDFKNKVDSEEITGSDANTRYWIRLFRKDVENVVDFLDVVKG